MEPLRAQAPNASTNGWFGFCCTRLEFRLQGLIQLAGHSSNSDVCAERAAVCRVNAPDTTLPGQGECAVEQGRYHKRVRRDALALVPDRAGRVLDLGGGVGAAAAELKRLGRAERAVLVDLVADGALAEIDRSFAGDLEDALFLDRVIAEEGPFDTVLCLDVLEHLRDPWTVVARLHRGLAPGGTIVASIPNAGNIRLVWPLVVHGRFDLADGGICDRTHLRWFVRDTAIALMTGTGLSLERVVGKITDGRRYRWLQLLTFGVFRRFLEIQYLIRVRRTD